MLISGVPIAYWIDYGCTKSDGQWSWRVPIALQCVFAITAGVCMFFLPDTPRYYYAKNRHAEGDDALERLNDAPIESESVQRIKQEILFAIEAEDEAASSLHWKQFLTSGIIDHTPMRIIRRLCICFWLPMIREWMGSSLMAYYIKSLPCLFATLFLMLVYRLGHSQPCRRTTFASQPSRRRAQHLLRSGLRAALFHHRTSWPPFSADVRRLRHVRADPHLHGAPSRACNHLDPMGRYRHHLRVPLRLRLRVARLRVALLL